jgi:hypothetical protein
MRVGRSPYGAVQRHRGMHQMRIYDYESEYQQQRKKNLLVLFMMLLLWESTNNRMVALQQQVRRGLVCRRGSRAAFVCLFIIAWQHICGNKCVV